MKRLLFVPILGGIIAAIIICGMSGASSYSKQITQILDNAENEMIQGNCEKAAEYADYAESVWVDAESKLNIFLNHADTAEIGITLSKLSPLARYGDLSEYLAESNTAKVQLIHMSAMESINN